MMGGHYDVAVIGGGSGGFGAALAAARLGCRVTLVERLDVLGGTSVRGGVNCWEMGAGGTGIPFDLYRRLKRIPNAVGVYSFGRHWCWPRPDVEPYRFPGGEQVIDPRRRYLDTLRRYGSKGMGADEAFCREHWHGLPFEPDIMARMMRAMLDETGRCDVRLGTSLAGAAAEQGRVTSVSLSTGETVSADTYVDGTGDALLCAAVRCRMRQGQESRGEYGEPGAPDAANRRINGVTLIYRITPRDPAEVDPLPEGIPESCWWQSQFPGICMNHYPNGDRNVNMLPTMEGQEFLDRGYDAAHAECRRRVLAHWHHLQTTYDEFRQFRLCWIAPILGVRESWRVVGEYVLKQQDLLSGLTGQTHDDIICIADHAMDTHGHGTGRAGCGEVKEPYGVPFRCLVPRGFRNLLVACRAASFSSIAASSCRLTRTMMQLGQAAGTAAAIAGARGRDVCETPPAALRQALRDQHVQLEWPATPGLLDHLRNEDVP